MIAPCQPVRLEMQPPLAAQHIMQDRPILARLHGHLTHGMQNPRRHFPNVNSGETPVVRAALSRHSVQVHDP